MLLAISVLLSAGALILMVRKKYLSATAKNAQVSYRAITVRRLSVSFAIALGLYLSYRLELREFPYTLAYYFALPLLWVVCIIAFWLVVDYLDASKSKAAIPVASSKNQSYTNESPVDRIYAWSSLQNDKE